MPRELRTDADPEELVSIRAQIPGWLKNQVSEVLRARGKSLTDWLKDQMRALLAEEKANAAREHQGKRRR